MITIRPTGAIVPPATPVAQAQSCYEMEVEALQQDLIDMNAEMHAAVSEAERNNGKAYWGEQKRWEGKIEARRAALAALAGRFKTEEHHAIALYQADVLKFERLNQCEISRLRRSMPRPERAPRVAPTPRLHRTGVTSMCKPPAPTSVALQKAHGALRWLHDSGIQQRHAQGQPFLKVLREGPQPTALKGVSEEVLAILHVELSALPASKWHTLAPAIARAMGAGGKTTAAPPRGAKQPGWMQLLQPAGWRRLSSWLWPSGNKP